MYMKHWNDTQGLIDSLLREVNLVNSLPESHALKAGDFEFVFARLTGTVRSLRLSVSIGSRIIKPPYIYVPR